MELDSTMSACNIFIQLQMYIKSLVKPYHCLFHLSCSENWVQDKEFARFALDSSSG